MDRFSANSSVRKMEYETKKKSPPLPDVRPIKSKVIGKISSSSMGEMLIFMKLGLEPI